MARKASKIPNGLPNYLARLYEFPVLTREQEQYLFRKYNYCKYRAAKLAAGLYAANPRAESMDQIEDYYARAEATRNILIECNLRLVISIAKKYGSEGFDERVSNGNDTLFKAVEKFDYARGNKFSTYASWAIRRNFSRDFKVSNKIRSKEVSVGKESMVEWDDNREDPYSSLLQHEKNKQQISLLLSFLDDERDIRIIKERFGFNEEKKAKTLKEVGEIVGVTKERVRQIETRVLGRLADAALSLRSTEEVERELDEILNIPECHLIMKTIKMGGRKLAAIQAALAEESFLYGDKKKLVAFLKKMQNLGLIKKTTNSSQYKIAG